MIIDQMAEAIRNQVKRGILISDHLIERALDISFQGLTMQDKAVFVEIARMIAKKMLVEDDHFHLEFN